MSDPPEIELKLDVPVDSLSRLASSPLLKGSSETTPRRSNVVSIYYDTGGHKLHRKGLSLRVRRVGRRLVQTVKQENGGNAACSLATNGSGKSAAGKSILTLSTTRRLGPC